MTETYLLIVATVFLAVIMLPFIAYVTVKLGTYAHLRAKDLYREQHQHPRNGAKKHHGDKKAEGKEA